MVSLAYNSNKCDPSALSCIGKYILVGSPHLMNGLCSRICVWSVVRDVELKCHSDTVRKESGRPQ